ncbi:MAG: hypothetical protein QNJ03_13085 [Dinoroseobacter sp.]|nr:hypothetical protein [Dinoroseobacter sp.]
MLTSDLSGGSGLIYFRGFIMEVNKFDYRGENEILYEENSVVIRSFPAINALHGPVSYSSEWHDLRFVFSSDSYTNKWFIEHGNDAEISIEHDHVRIAFEIDHSANPFFVTPDDGSGASLVERSGQTFTLIGCSGHNFVHALGMELAPLTSWPSELTQKVEGREFAAESTPVSSEASFVLVQTHAAHEAKVRGAQGCGITPLAILGRRVRLPQLPTARGGRRN